MEVFRIAIIAVNAVSLLAQTFCVWYCMYKSWRVLPINIIAAATNLVAIVALSLL